MKQGMIAAMLALAAASSPVIELGPAGEDWRVRYTLATPAKALHFEIPYEDYRQTAWRPDDPAVRIVADGEDVRAERSDGRTFTSLSFRLTPRYREVPQNYAPFSPFSDGGVLVFTGQFHACADAPCADDPRWRVRVSAPGRQLLAGGVEERGRAAFADSGEGTLVYAGPQKPLSGPYVFAVIDPALPSPIRDQLDTLLPRLTAYFSDAFGALKERPTLFASLDRWPRPNSGLSYQGGALPGQVFLHFYGSDWRADAAKADFIPWFFAHEAAHFYHGARSGDAATSEDEAWIHEGGAEAFAALALRAFGDAAYVDRRVARTFDACAAGVAGLGDKPLSASAKAGAFQNHYDCGLVIQLAIDAELRSASDGRESLVTLWADFLDRVEADAPWTGDTFLGTARAHGLSEATARTITDLTTTPQKPDGAGLRALLKL